MSKKRRTNIIRAGIGNDPAYNAVIPPLYLSSTYAIDGLDKRGTYEYSRTKNPTRDELAKALAELEGGIGAAVTSSGMAALTLIVHLLEADDLVFAPYDMYGRAYWLLRALSEKGHFKLKFIDMYDADALDEAFKDAPKMVIVESPSNPVMRVADIEDIAQRTHAHDGLLVCDNTFLTPMHQQPFALGADIVYHSTTKFLNGHSDVVGGCVIVNSSQNILDEVHLWNNSLGTIGAPFDSYMTLRGMRTLEVRVSRASENAHAIAEFLLDQPRVTNVYYPGLPSHDGHHIAAKQQSGFGAMISFELEGDVDAFLKGLEIFTLAQSLGGTESLINHPASMTHVSMGAEAREKAGISDNLLRLSVGIEHIDDLLDDLKAAFTA